MLFKLTAKVLRSQFLAITRKMSTLQKVISEMENFAPIKYAESWDNVGLLIEPSSPQEIKTIFLTNDLTEPVMHEAISKKANLIISYHPPVFAPLKRITQSTWKERIVSLCLENKIALYSPHTAWDVAKNGVNDWLASTFPYTSSLPIKPIPDCDGGIGRIIKLNDAISLGLAIEKVKAKAKIPNVLVGTSFKLNNEIKTVAICAGSGASVLKDVEADLYVTGEMSHHDVLDANSKNISVILCNHSNSERGYLNEFKGILKKLIGESVNVIVSEVDVDPLKTY